ncbi:cycloartenol-C-24-methyltransferase-like [Actinidia eriantha]|uniref:cycloartenol-C-24-methyltransferase-like n=1 Tax=Actinidia eriantha TaxID=165200 RepID=UPI002585DDA3|nr:cycloartenol-C-24-methyltransferase-like [Actinidia eriantha]XP_057510804.1 cycloartenol-C-24-methyltransferase-like [Actinidia eriantha]
MEEPNNRDYEVEMTTIQTVDTLLAHYCNSVSSERTEVNDENLEPPELNLKAGVDKTCDFVKADFMKMPFPDNSFDAVYSFEATCHAPNVVGCYKEICRVLKPGHFFAASEWCMTNSFNPQNKEHPIIREEIEFGNGLHDIRTTGQCLEALKQAGFEVILVKDLREESPLPW